MHRIIGNPTVTPRAVPTKLSQLENDAQFITKDALSEIDVEGIPSVVYTELDNFTDGVCKVIPKSPGEPLYFDDIRGGFTEEDNIYVLSEMYALCLANYVYYDESEQYRTVSQTLIFPGGAIYCRNRHEEDTSDGWSEGVWNEWKPFTVELAQKAYRDGNNKIITDTYATKEELGDYATKDDLSGIDGEGIPSIIYTDLDNFTDGVCKITMNGEWGLFDGEIFNTEYSEWVNSEMYALCLANDIEGDTYHMYSQTLIFPDGGTYKRSKNSDFDYGTGEWSDATWSKWQPFRAYEATKAYADANGKNIATTYATKEEFTDKYTWKLLGEATVTEANVTDAGEDGVKEIAVDCVDLSGYDELRINLKCDKNAQNSALTATQYYYVHILKTIDEKKNQSDNVLIFNQGITNAVLRPAHTNNLIINSYFTNGILQYSETLNTNYNSHCYNTAPSVSLPSYYYKWGYGEIYGKPINLNSGNHIVLLGSGTFKFPAGTELKVYGR
jgi:hypothetical protein